MNSSMQCQFRSGWMSYRWEPNHVAWCLGGGELSRFFCELRLGEASFLILVDCQKSLGPKQAGDGGFCWILKIWIIFYMLLDLSESCWAPILKMFHVTWRNFQNFPHGYTFSHFFPLSHIFKQFYRLFQFHQISMIFSEISWTPWFFAIFSDYS